MYNHQYSIHFTHFLNNIETTVPEAIKFFLGNAIKFRTFISVYTRRYGYDTRDEIREVSELKKKVKYETVSNVILCYLTSTNKLSMLFIY